MRALHYLQTLQKKRLAMLFYLLTFFTLQLFSQTLEVLTVTPSKTDVLTGEDFTYSLEYRCAGITGNCNGQQICTTLPAEIANNVILFGDAFTASFSYNDATQTACWTMGALATGSTGQLTLSCRFRDNFTPEGTTAALTVGTVTAATVTAHTDPKLFAEKYGPASVGVDGTVTYNLGIKNATNNGSSRGGVFQDNVTLTDTWPAGGVYVSHTQNPTFPPPTISGNSITYYPGTMSSGDGTGFSVTIQYPTGSFPIGSSIVNNVVGTGVPRGSASINSNTASVTTNVEAAKCDIRIGFRSDQTSPSVTAGANPRSLYGWGNYVQIEAGNASNVPASIDIVHDIPIAYYPINFTVNNNTSTGAVNYYYKTNLNNSAWIPYTLNPVSVPFGGANISPASMAPGAGEYVTQIRITNSGPMPAGGSYSMGYGYDFSGTDRNGTTVVGDVSLKLQHAETCDPAGLGSGYPYTIPQDLIIKQKPAYVELGLAKYVNPGAATPGGKVTYTLRWDLQEVASTSPPVNPIITDLLPLGMDYVVGSGRKYSANPSIIIPLPAGTIEEVFPNFNGTGRTLVRWKFIGIYGQNANEGKEAVLFDAKVKPGTAVSVQNNDWGVSASDLPGSSSFAWPNTGRERPDVNNVNGVFGTTDFIVTSDPVSVNVLSLAALESYKWVKGSLDVAENRYPSTGKTIQGGITNYRLVVRNLGNIQMGNIKVIDILPYVGDKAVIGTQDRLSAWRPYMTSAVSFLPNNPNIQVYYSASPNPCRPEVYNASGCVNDWNTTPPADLSTVQALKFDFGTLVMNGADSFQLSWNMKAPVDAPTGGELAWNSFAYSATRQDNSVVLSPSEPVKVGISANADTKASIGDFVWIDTNKDGLQAGESGINNIKVYLLNNLGVVIDSTVTADKGGLPGYYLFGNLDAGQYSIKFVLPTAAYQFTINTNNTDDGSDAYITGICSAIILAAGDKNISIDAGIYLKPTCVFPKRTIKVTDPTCIAKGTIELITATNATHFGIQNSAVYTAPLFASATIIPSILPAILENNISNASDLVYNIRIFNGVDNCFIDTTVTVKAAPTTLPTPMVSFTDPKCNAGTDGTITLTVTGAVGTPSYLWSNGATTKDLTGLSANTYSVTITDGACSTNTSVTLNEPTAMTVTCSKTDVTTNGGNDGKANVTPNGGTGAYTYLWSNGNTTSSISGVTANTYSVTVTDANGCTITCSSIVNEPACNLGITSTTTQPTCANNDGVINITVTGLVGTPTFLWSNSATTEDINSLGSGDYVVTVTDGACTVTKTISLDIPNTNTQYSICVGEKYKLEIQINTLTNIQWFRDGVAIVGANSLSYDATQIGIYTYTSNGVGGCAVGQCCPIEIVAGTNCCKPVICTSVKLTRN